MIIKLFFIFNFALTYYAYKIVFLKGSFISNELYTPLLKSLNYENIEFGNYNCDYNSKEETILICHSFGGYFGLLNCMKNENIKGCVLINSHFNQRFKMPYFGINMDQIKQPVLTILNTDDNFLPLAKGIDDFFVQSNKKKYFIINQGDHFSSFSDDNTSKQINHFINSISNNNFTKYENINYDLYYKINWDFNNTFEHTQFENFLKSKPINKNQIFSDSEYTYYKTNNINIIDSLNNNFDVQINWNIKILKTNSKIEIPKTLLKWFIFKPKIKTSNNYVGVDVLLIPIDNNDVYYKFPSKFSILQKIELII